MSSDYARIEQAIGFLERRAHRQPSLEELAAELGLSPFHCQRLFRRWVGVSPKRFLQYLTVNHAKRLLRESASVLEATFEVGLSSPGRLHDHFVSLEAVTPGEYKHLGAGLEIRWGFHDSPFGDALIAVTRRGVCGLAFTGDESEAERWLARQWPRADLLRDEEATRALAREIFESGGPVPLFVRGTNFQIQVWKALLSIPPARLCSYGQLAAAVGRPKAVRAVGGAVGANRVAYLIPCHRVVRKLGEIGGYRWGSERKRALIAWESARASLATDARGRASAGCIATPAG